VTLEQSTAEFADDDPAVRPDIAVLAGNPDEAELAAVTAVLAEVLEELAEEQGRRDLSGVSAWDRSRRSLRTPLAPGPGAWRGFSG
jgi:hypothetical protein